MLGLLRLLRLQELLELLLYETLVTSGAEEVHLAGVMAHDFLFRETGRQRAQSEPAETVLKRLLTVGRTGLVSILGAGLLSVGLSNGLAHATRATTHARRKRARRRWTVTHGRGAIDGRSREQTGAMSLLIVATVLSC